MSEVDPLAGRWDVRPLQADVGVIVSFIRNEAESLLGEWSDWSPEEKQRHQPGLQLLVELSEFEYEQAESSFASLREVTTGKAAQLWAVDQARENPRYRLPSEVEEEQQDAQAYARRLVRHQLGEVVELARELGVQDTDVAGLLAQVLTEGGPEPDGTGSERPGNGVRLPTNRRRRPIGPS